ncbi:FadR family transcriptional regulator [Proteus mirabilis]|nr:FadR family transcriptional regulator [Proteus mirabilis]
MIQKISRQKASHQILEQIKQNISNGTYPIGEKLPSENVLADAFGVSRVPIREALGVLEASGIVTSRQGGGRRVIDHSILSKYEPLVMEIACPEEIDSLLEMREVIEHEAAAIAALRRTPEELCAIENAHDAFVLATRQNKSIGHKEDYQFHRSIMIASHNPFFVRILDNLHELYLGVLMYSLSKNKGRDTEIERVITEHEAIVESIRQQDHDETSNRMRLHLTNVRGKLKRLQQEPY